MIGLSTTIIISKVDPDQYEGLKTFRQFKLESTELKEFKNKSFKQIREQYSIPQDHNFINQDQQPQKDQKRRISQIYYECKNQYNIYIFIKLKFSHWQKINPQIKLRLQYCYKDKACKDKYQQFLDIERSHLKYIGDNKDKQPTIQIQITSNSNVHNIVKSKGMKFSMKNNIKIVDPVVKTQVKYQKQVLEEYQKTEKFIKFRKIKKRITKLYLNKNGITFNGKEFKRILLYLQDPVTYEYNTVLPKLLGVTDTLDDQHLLPDIFCQKYKLYFPCGLITIQDMIISQETVTFQSDLKQQQISKSIQLIFGVVEKKLVQVNNQFSLKNEESFKQFQQSQKFILKSKSNWQILEINSQQSVHVLQAFLNRTNLMKEFGIDLSKKMQIRKKILQKQNIQKVYVPKSIICIVKVKSQRNSFLKVKTSFMPFLGSSLITDHQLSIDEKQQSIVIQFFEYQHDNRTAKSRIRKNENYLKLLENGQFKERKLDEAAIFEFIFKNKNQMHKFMALKSDKPEFQIDAIRIQQQNSIYKYLTMNELFKLKIGYQPKTKWIIKQK